MLEQLAIPGNTRVSELPGDLRTRIALEAAWARGAEVIGFTTLGLNPVPIYRAVESKLAGCPALHLSYPGLNAERVCPPRAKCLDLAAPVLTGQERSP
jgi:hypothetical protein